MLSVNNKYIDMAGISWRFTQGEKNSDTYEIRAPRYDESGSDLLALSWSMVGSNADYGTLIASAVSVSEDNASGSVVFSWRVSSDFTACDGVLDLCLQGSDSSGNVVIKYRSSGVRVAPTLSGNLNAPQNVIEQVLSQIALTLPQCAAAVEAAKTATEKAATAVTASNTATQKATGATASAKAAATSATAAKASETTAAQKSTAAAASATAAASSSTLATTKAAEAAASATAAQGYKVQTQQLRDEVHTIVAGNEAYTKQETRDKFSRALEVESPAAAAQVIAVEPQSDLRPRYYGFTEQAGADVVSGVNLCPPLSKLVSGVTYSAGTDCTSTANGTATGWAAANIKLPYALYQLFGDCTVSIKISGVSKFARGYAYVESYKGGVKTSSVEAAFTSTSESTISKTGTIASNYEELLVGFTFPPDTVFTNAKIYVMAEKGTTASSFVPYIENTGAPSPTNIRPITVGGNAANLIPFPYRDGNKASAGITYTVQADGGIKCVGTATVASFFNLCNDPFVGKPRGNYFLSGSPNNKSQIYIVETSPTVYFFDAGSGISVPIKSDKTYGCSIRIDAGTTINTTIYPMLNAGDSAYPYTPYTGYDYAGLMAAQGANLIPFPYTDGMSKTVSGVTFTVNDDKSITLSGTSTAWVQFYLAQEMPKLPHGAFVLHSNGIAIPNDVYITIQVDPNTGKSKVLSYGNATLIFDSQKDEKIMGAYIGINSGTSVNMTIYPMLNVGTTALPYEPYIPPTNYALPSPVALPDGCSVKAGYVDADKMIVFDGSENWQGYLSGNYFVAVITPEVKTNTNNQNVFANLFPQSITSGVFTNSGGQIAVNISKDIVSTPEQLKTKLARLATKGTPLTIYYQSTSYAGEKMPVWLVNVTKKKVVLNGSEKWTLYNSTQNNFYVDLPLYKSPITEYPKCSHYSYKHNLYPPNIPNNMFSVQGNIRTIFRDDTKSEVSDWKAYLAEQYNAGTPVTLTYTIATPETYAIPYTRCESPDTVNCTISTPEGTCSAQYNADLRTYIDRLQSAIIALGGTI